MADPILVPPDHTVPVAFTRAQLEWLPWLEPLAVEALTERHVASLFDRTGIRNRSDLGRFARALPGWEPAAN